MNNTVQLRALTIEDLSFLQQIENNPSYWHLSDTTEAFSEEVLIEYILASNKPIKEVGQERFVIALKDQTAVGFVDLFNFNYLHKRAGVGIIIEKEYRALGYASQALKLISEYAKKELKIHQLYAHILEDNHKSMALFEKAGFLKIANKSDWHYSKGVFKDELLYQLIL
jgi:diamine N-acetyltransferase